MTNKKTIKFPLKIMLIVCASILALSIVIACIFGFNASVEFGGGSQLKVEVSETSALSNAYAKTTKTLKNKGLHVESAFVEDNNDGHFVVVRLTDKTIKNADDIRAAVAEAANVDVSNVSNFEAVRGSLTTNFILMLSLSILLIAMVVFFGGWLRYGVAGATTLTVVYLGSIIMYLAALIITRVPISSGSLAVMGLSSIIAVIASILVCEFIRANAKTKQFEDHSVTELVTEGANGAIMPLCVLVAFVAVFSIISLFAPNALVKLTAVSLLLGLIVSIGVGLFVGCGILIALTEAAEFKKKLQVSKNPNLNKK